MSEETKSSKLEQENSEDSDNDGSNKAEPGSERQTNQIKETGSVIINEGKFPVCCITIVGEIEGHSILSSETKTTKYEHVIPQLVSIEQSPKIEGLLIILNTVGGDIEAGLALAELISGMKKPSVSLVIGGGHSIGVPLATSSDFSFITQSATMIVHPVRMNGFVIGIAQTFEYFKKMQERINEFIVRTSNIREETLQKFMLQTNDLLNDVGTLLIGKQAVDCGLIDEVGGISEAINKLRELINAKKK